MEGTAQQLDDQRAAGPPNEGVRRMRAERLAPFTGVAPLLLGLAGLIVWEGPADRPEYDASPVVILRYFGDRDVVIAGGFLLMLAAAFLLCFCGYLRVVLRRDDGGAGGMSALAFAGGATAAAFMLAMPASNVFGALYAEQLSARGAQTFYLFGDVFLYPAAMASAVLVSATALAALRSGALPRWLAWLSLALAVWLLVPPLGSAAGSPENPAAWTGLAALSVVPLWSAAVAVAIVRSASRRRASART